MPEKLFAGIIVLLTTTIFGVLLRIHSFSNSFKKSSVHAELWKQSNGKNKYAKTIYEIEERPKPCCIIKSYYVYSDSAQKWFSFGIIFTLLQVFIAIATYALKKVAFVNIPDGELIFLLSQVTILVCFVIWLSFCFKKYICENNRKRDLDIHVNNVASE